MTVAEKMSQLEDMVCPGVTACLGCNAELSMRTALKILGKNTIVAVPPGCMGGVQSVGWADKSGMKIPVFFPLLDNTASMLSGIKKYYQRIGRDVNVVAFAGDGASVDAGFQALSAAAERGDNIIYICYDNEGYMNTGFQRSSSTGYGSWTSTTPVGSVVKGKTSHKKDMPMIMAAHDIPYMATCSPAYMPDFIKKIEKAKEVKQGLAYIHTYNVSYVPVMEAMKLTDGAKMRESGGFDFVSNLYMEKLNSHYICASTDGLTYNLYTKTPIEDLSDFQGMTIRATPAYQAFVEGLGSGVVNTAPGEAYQALERNVIQGYGWPSVGVTDFGWQEVSKYIIEPPFYNVDVAVFVSEKAWNTLSANQQNAILEAGREIEEEAKEYYVKAIADHKAALVAAGMEELKLEDSVAQAYVKMAYEKGWESAVKVDAENAGKLQEFAGYNR